MTRPHRREAVLDIYQFALAAALFASPWLFAFMHNTGTATTDATVSALLVAAVSAVALRMFREWEEWINVILGVWIAASPWVLGFGHTPASHVMLGFGILIAYLALMELWLVHNPDYYTLPPPQEWRPTPRPTRSSANGHRSRA